MMWKYLRAGALCLFALVSLAGCGSSGYSSSVGLGVSSGYYHGNNWHDPYYYRPCCHNTVVVRPPPHYRPPTNHRPSTLPAQLPSRARPARRR